MDHYLPTVLTIRLVEFWIRSEPDDVKPDNERAKTVLLDLDSRHASHYMREAIVWSQTWAATPGESSLRCRQTWPDYRKEGVLLQPSYTILFANGNEYTNYALAKKPTFPQELMTDYKATHGNAIMLRFRPGHQRQGPAPY